MGLSFRKSIGSKNLRLNLSKSGPSISTGIKGVRVVTRHKGGVRLYGQKSVAGTQLRYIKTVGPSKKNKLNKKTNFTSNKIKSISQKQYCSECGKLLDFDSNFCEYCGAKL
jgi:hypothetical protein